VSRYLDHYVEAQVHGTVDLARDVARDDGVVDAATIGRAFDATLDRAR